MSSKKTKCAFTKILIANKFKRCLHPFASEHLSPCLQCRDIDIKSFKNCNFICGFVCVLTWWCTLREEHVSRVFGNRVLRRIFQLKREKVTEGWRKFHNEEIHN